MNHNREHIRRHAERHHEAHAKLKRLLQKLPPKEKMGPLFISTFFMALISFGLYANWGIIEKAFTPLPPPAPPETHGFKTGITATLKLDGQASEGYRQLLASIPTSGTMLGIKSTHLIAQKPKKEPDVNLQEGVQKAVEATQGLSTGQHLTKFNQNRAGSLQKSVLATYYLGQKTVDLGSTIQNDTELLTKMNNALSVDLFGYLNQSAARADSLDGYLNLLKALLAKAQERSADLNTKINFLSANFTAQEVQLERTEEAFLNHLKIFNGPEADKELEKFIGLQTENTEVKAKLGAYQGLRGYYLFFQPRLENMINSIQANRDPLIAGVKVVEIENMTLPLIIRNKR